MTTSAPDALERLQDGNRRFIGGPRQLESLADAARREELAAGQAPFAVILGCADSRVPAEIVFDQGLGDLFVVRVAGNIATPTQVGSIEYAVEMLGSRLIVVLGHSGCGAVQATLDTVRAESADLSEGLSSLVDHIRPAVEPLLDDDAEIAAVLPSAVRANVVTTVAELRRVPALENQIREHGLEIVGAEYDLKTGVVTFFDDGP
ncbi:MAG: carbonic anhydrase [Acidobacteriota bacterium]